MTVVDLQNLEIENLKLGKSGRAVKLMYNKEPVQICTSTLYCPFGVKFVAKEWSNFTEYYIDCFYKFIINCLNYIFVGFIYILS